MKKALLLIAAAMFVLAGCQKEQAEQEATSNNVIHIGVKQLAPPTKVVANATELADLNADAVNFEWEEGDQVAFVDYYEFLEYMFEAFEGGVPETPETTVYTCTDPTNKTFSGPGLDPAGEYMAVYPPSGISSFIFRSTYEETYRFNQIPEQHMITSDFYQPVTGSDTEFTLNTHSSIIHFKIKGTAKIGRIVYKVTYNEEEEEDGQIITPTALNFQDGVQLNGTPIDVYMDVAYFVPGGFSLEFFDTSGGSLGEKNTTFYFKDDYRNNTIIDFEEPITVNAAE